MTKIIQIPIGEIKPDKNQPRQRFNDAELEDLAQNIRKEGVINPIEIDNDNVIVTGERRWKAAKIAELETVPCFVNDIRGKERFKHQLSENLHHNTMSELDTAKALHKLLVDHNLHTPGKGKMWGGWNDKGIAWLVSEMGKSEGYVRDKLNLLDETLEFQEAVDKGKVSPSMTRSIKRCPKKHKDTLRRKIIDGEIKSRDGARELAIALEEHPEKAEELLAIPYRKMNNSQMINTIRHIAPSEKEETMKALKEELEDGMEITRMAKDMINLLAKRPLERVSKTNLSLLLIALSQLRGKLDDYLQGQDIPEIIEQ